MTDRALATGGASLAHGFANVVEDVRTGRISPTDERAFGVGTNLAVTPAAGRGAGVVYAGACGLTVARAVPRPMPSANGR